MPRSPPWKVSVIHATNAANTGEVLSSGLVRAAPMCCWLMLSRVQPQKKCTAPAAPNQAIVAAGALPSLPRSAALTLATTSTASATTSWRKVDT